MSRRLARICVAWSGECARLCRIQSTRGGRGRETKARCVSMWSIDPWPLQTAAVDSRHSEDLTVQYEFPLYR
jgi:hypothetical protein